MSIVDPFSGPTDLDTLASAAESNSQAQNLKSFGLPDPVFLTRFANELFSALPNQSFPISHQPSVAGVGLTPHSVLGQLGSPSPPSQETSLPGATQLNTKAEAPALPSLAGPKDAQHIALDHPRGDLSSQGIDPFKNPSLPFNMSGGQNNFLKEDVLYRNTNALKADEKVLEDANLLTLNEVVRTSHDFLPEVLVGLSEGVKSNVQHASLSHILETLKKEDAEFNNYRNKLNSDELKNPPQHFGISVPASLRMSHENDLIPSSETQDLRKFVSGLETFNERKLKDTNKLDNLYFLHQTSSSHSEQSQEKGVEVRDFSSSHPPFDVVSVRKDFPLLQETVNGRPLIWFDNAATTQKPSIVIERLKYFYEHENSNIHRAAHEMAARATDAYEEARSKVAKFIGANSKNEIIFTRGATEAINLVAATLGQVHLSKDDEILITHLEHHANIVPWQQLAFSKGAKLKVAPVDDNGVLLLEEFGRLLTNKTKLVSFTHVSNALGTITPAKTLIEMAHKVGAYVLVDGAQSVSHMKVNVQELDADFFVFSGHKLFAPTGIGVLYGKKRILERLPPYQTGGNMIKDVTFERTVFNGSPERFEAGTGNIADAVGLGAAIDYVERIGLDNIASYEHELLIYATERICQIPNLKIIGKSPEKASLISFVIEGISSEEIGAKLNGYGIAVRAGHHCAQPILRRYNLESTVRPSFAFYNTFKEIDELVSALKIITAETSSLSS